MRTQNLSDFQGSDYHRNIQRCFINVKHNFDNGLKTGSDEKMQSNYKIRIIMISYDALDRYIGPKQSQNMKLEFKDV